LPFAIILLLFDASFYPVAAFLLFPTERIQTSEIGFRSMW